jgi:hypothetical protein
MSDTKPKSRKSVYIGAAILVIVIVVASAYYYYASAPKALVFTANMTGSEEVPPNMSSGMGVTGTTTVMISPDRTSLHFVVVVNNIYNVTLSHIHLGQRGQNGPVVVNFFLGPMKPGSFSGTLAQGDVTSSNFVGPLAGHPMSELVNDLQSGMCYVNVHNTQRPAGEIRGQLQPASQ